MECIINRFLSLRLEDGKSRIYVNGKPFLQCKRLVLNIPLITGERYDDVNSIDEAAARFCTFHDGHGMGSFALDAEIEPEVEFWGHCSNLEAWYENGYDTRLLHSNLAFPLLKALVEAGDQAARNAFASEIMSRTRAGYLPVIEFLAEEGYYEHVSDEDIEYICERFPGISKSPGAPARALERLATHHDKDIRVAVALNPNTPEATLKALLAKNDKDIRFAIAMNCVSPEIFKLLSLDDDVEMRRTVAESYKTSPEVLEILSKDSSHEVKICVIENKFTPLVVLTRMAITCYKEIVHVFSVNPGIQQASMRGLESDEESTIWMTIASNLMMTERLLPVLMRNNRKIVRKQSGSPSYKMVILEMMSQLIHILLTAS